jgi:hypothetical protein
MRCVYVSTPYSRERVETAHQRRLLARSPHPSTQYSHPPHPAPHSLLSPTHPPLSYHLPSIQQYIATKDTITITTTFTTATTPVAATLQYHYH